MTATADGTTGAFSVSIPVSVAPPLSVTQTVNGYTSDPVSFNTAPLPIATPAIAGFGVGGWSARPGGCVCLPPPHAPDPVAGGAVGCGDANRLAAPDRSPHLALSEQRASRASDHAR